MGNGTERKGGQNGKVMHRRFSLLMLSFRKGETAIGTFERGTVEREKENKKGKKKENKKGK